MRPPYQAHWALLQQLDRMRQAQGRLLEAAGAGPLQTPYRIVHRRAGVALRRYDGAAESEAALLIVPAPIKRPYIWDLEPTVSAVRRCLAARRRVFLAEWQRAPEHFGLADYAVRMIGDCLDAAGAEAAILLGHSLGGLFAAIFAALHTERVRAVVLLASPLDFGSDARAFHRMVHGLEASALPEAVPGSCIGMASFAAAPGSFGWERWSDAALSLADPAALRTHLQVERWMLDEFPLPRQLVAELATLIVRENRFARGLLEIDGRRAGPAGLAAPLLCVLDPRCALVPPGTMLRFVDAAASRDKTVLHYARDVGVALQHVGPLVSRRAHATLWPQIVRWIESH